MSRASSSPGDLIADRFLLRERLGVGGMGEVWRATQTNLERDVALKLLLPEHAAAEGARARFEREARVASQLKHRNAVQIYDFGEDGENLFIAMELLHGTTLRAIVDRDLPTPPVARTLDLLGQVCEALIVAHDLNLVHRDLKPENVFLESQGDHERAVVVDFGLAFIADRPGADRLTREGVASGTPDYMAPEQAAGDVLGPAADVYALGTMLFEMLVGEPPFSGTAMQVITQQLFSPAPSPRERAPDEDVPPELDALCLRMLAKLPEERPSIREVREILVHGRTAAGERERGRDATHLQGRAARMISAAHAATASPYGAPIAGAPATLAVVGALGGDLVVALGASGVLPYIVSSEQPVDGAHAIYAPGASLDDVESLRAHGLPLITDVAPDQMAFVTQLLRAGVDEVLTRPVRAEELARRVWRAVRRHHRRTGGAK